MEEFAALHAFRSVFNNSFTAWENGVISGQPAQYQAQTEEILRRWRAYVEELRARSDVLMENSETVDRLSTLVRELQEEQSVLDRLRSEAGTRSGQADSLNPKVRPSPYTNILGLQRTFRESTRFTIMIMSIVFGVLALGVMGFLTYSVVQSGTLIKSEYRPAQYGGGSGSGSGSGPRK